MGKDLRGKELGVGISQRKDGLYTARFTDKRGKRRQKYFKKLQECRKWLADAQFKDENENVLATENPTVDSWFCYWMDQIKCNNIRYNTRLSYEERYQHNIGPYIGNMQIKSVRPVHCQNVLIQMADKYANSVIALSRLVMKMMFDSAVENELLLKNPVTKSIKCTSGRKSKERLSMTTDEQKRFLKTITGSDFYNQYALVLQTGLRVGEMSALCWADIDFKNRIIHVHKSMQYRYVEKKWSCGETKTKNGIRDIPMTQEAICILKNQQKKIRKLKICSIEYPDMVFLGQDGMPIKNTNYNKSMIHYCRKAQIPNYSMHSLRHTFATRCIEAGMRPKTLQIILGHSNIGTTMNLYVHVTNDEKIKEVQSVENMLKGMW